jgi:hypothetical protein
LQTYLGADSFQIRARFRDDGDSGLSYCHSPDSIYWPQAFIRPPPPYLWPSVDGVDFLWTEWSNSGFYCLNFARLGHGNGGGGSIVGPPSFSSGGSGDSSQTQTYYSASFGDSVQSHYCLARDGYVHYHGYKVDYARDSLRYRLPYLAELYRYAVCATFYQESEGRLTQSLRLGDTTLLTVDVDSAQPVTVWFDIPARRYLDGTAHLTLKRLSGSRAVLSDIKVYQYDARREHGGGGPTQTAGIAPILRTVIRSAIPNPFTGRTSICYEIGASGPVSLRVFDVSGRVVRVLESRAGGAKTAGPHITNWNGLDDRGRRVSGGVYFCRLEANGHESTTKVVCTQ